MFALKDVCIDDIDIFFLCELALCNFSKGIINLDGDTIARPFSQALGQRACAAADL